MAGHGILLPFDCDSPEFARGFEVGRVWALLRADPTEEIVEYAHAVNAEMMIRMGEVTGRRAWSEEIGDGWLVVTFEPSVLQEESV
jgi:hypothetical protein